MSSSHFPFWDILSQVSVFPLPLPDAEEKRVSQQMPALALPFGCATFRERGREHAQMR